MATVLYKDADGTEGSFTVGVQPVVVGRAPECTIRSNDPLLSRNHARFFLDHLGALCIEDLGSANGVFVGQHKVTSSIVPMGEIVAVGGMTFRELAQNEVPPPPLVADGAHEQALDLERNARVAAEQERDAYGARMAELHQELRGLREAQALAQQQARGELEQLRSKATADLEAMRLELQKAAEAKARANVPSDSPEARAEALAAELEVYRERLAEMEEQVKSANARLHSAEEELAVSRADLLAAEERLMSEVAATEMRANTELASRVDELAVARADLVNSEQRVLDLSRKVAELEQRLAEFTGRF